MANNKGTATEQPEEKKIEEKPKAVTLGKELTPNNMWKTMSIKQFGVTYVITEACNACTHSLVRTVTEKAGEVIHTSMTVIPNFTVKDIKNHDGDAIVVFTRGI